MKLYKLIGVSILSISLLGLFGCEAKQSSHSSQKVETNNESSDDNNAQNKDSSQTENNQQNQDNQSTNDSNKGDQSAQNDNSYQSGESQSGSSSQTSNAQSTPPQTKQEALDRMAAELNTKVPLMLPTNVPVNGGKYLTAITTSETWYYQIALYETDKPTNINSHGVSNGALIATVEGTEYKDETSAKDSVNNYLDTDTFPTSPTLDLGHGIKAHQDAGLGHGYIIWNEGRWCVELDSPNDSTYKNKKYPDSKKLAETIVTYLNDHVLPAPQTIGVININNWNNTTGTTIQWQYHEMTYQVKSQDPMKALQVAVAMRFYH